MSGSWIRRQQTRGGGRSSLLTALAFAVALSVSPAPAAAEPGVAAPSLPEIVPHESAWQPDYVTFPYNLWRTRVTPEQVVAMRDSCQWFNERSGVLMDQVLAFQRFLGDQRDDWTAPGVAQTAAAVVANVDQSAAFLQPRADLLYIVNYPDQSEYSPVFHGDSIHWLWYQLTQISDKINRRVPSGQLNANTATALVYTNAIRNSGVCVGA